jgi:hypothetical protein
MAKPAPSIGIEPARSARSFTSFGSNIDLTTQSGCPPHSPGLVYADNQSGTAWATIVVQGEDAVSATFSVAPGSVLIIPLATTKVMASGTSGLTRVTALWWESDRPDRNR